MANHIKIRKVKSLAFVEPAGATAYCCHFLAPNGLSVNEYINVMPGNWKLKYNSVCGMGSLKLQMKVFD